MEQLLCARGYSDQIAGLASSFYLLSGCVGAIPVIILASKTKKSLQISKVLLSIALLTEGAASYLVTVSDHQVILVTFFILSGLFGIRCALRNYGTEICLTIKINKKAKKI